MRTQFRREIHTHAQNTASVRKFVGNFSQTFDKKNEMLPFLSNCGRLNTVSTLLAACQGLGNHGKVRFAWATVQLQTLQKWNLNYLGCLTTTNSYGDVMVNKVSITL